MRRIGDRELAASVDEVAHADRVKKSLDTELKKDTAMSKEARGAIVSEVDQLVKDAKVSRIASRTATPVPRKPSGCWVAPPSCRRFSTRIKFRHLREAGRASPAHCRAWRAPTVPRGRPVDDGVAHSSRISGHGGYFGHTRISGCGRGGRRRRPPARPRDSSFRALAAALARIGGPGGVRDRGPRRGNVDALRSLRTHDADVVITDVSTTIDEDLAFAKELMSVRPAVKVIVLATAGERADLIEAIRTHVFACFTPPIDDGEVAAMVSRALFAGTWKDGIQVVSGLDHWLTLRVSCHLLTADRLIRFMTELQPSAGVPDRDLLIAAFRELVLNAMEHGAGFDADKVIEVTAAKTGRAIVYHFRDPGDGFDRADLQQATASHIPMT